MHVPFNENPLQEYVFSGVTLECIEAEKDLGVLTSSDLKWSKHIKSCISKANSVIAWVTRNLIIRERERNKFEFRSLLQIIYIS